MAVAALIAEKLQTYSFAVHAQKAKLKSVTVLNQMDCHQIRMLPDAKHVF